ncbi:MAG TPA: hypothetical protein VFO16_23330 [Pseudonocardiaceae bacterium]|nr:hypothetical protein [Pseudonocardiaceae bacterium]
MGSVCFPVDVDSGGIEITAVWASAPAGGQYGDGEECGQDGAAAADVEPVGAVGGGAVPDAGDVGLPGEPDQRVNRCSGGEGVLDVGEPGAECARAELGQGDRTLGERGGEVVEALADGGGLGVQCGGVEAGLGGCDEPAGGVGLVQAGHDDPLDVVVQVHARSTTATARAGRHVGAAAVAGPEPARDL